MISHESSNMLIHVIHTPQYSCMCTSLKPRPNLCYYVNSAPDCSDVYSELQ